MYVLVSRSIQFVDVYYSRYEEHVKHIKAIISPRFSTLKLRIHTQSTTAWSRSDVQLIGILFASAWLGGKSVVISNGISDDIK